MPDRVTAAIPEAELAATRALRLRARRALEVAQADGRPYDRALLEVLRSAVLTCAEQHGLDPERLSEARLFERAPDFSARGADWGELEAESIGTIYETLNAQAPGAARKRSGSFFTPRPLTRVV